MLFNSLSFAIFLPLVFVLYWLIAPRERVASGKNGRTTRIMVQIWYLVPSRESRKRPERNSEINLIEVKSKMLMLRDQAVLQSLKDGSPEQASKLTQAGASWRR